MVNVLIWYIQTRLQLEVNTMMAYGSSERSVRLLWRYGILEYILPLQARALGGQHSYLISIVCIICFVLVISKYDNDRVKLFFRPNISQI